MKKQFLESNLVYLIPVIIFGIYSILWLYIQQFDVDFTRDWRQLWGHTYFIVSVYGGIIGLQIAKKWGGFKSLLGKTIFILSIGLLFQSFGQIYSSGYVYLMDVESPPYPAIGDIGFFGSALLYTYGVILLSKLSGFSYSIKNNHNKFWAFVIPAGMLILSYQFFLKGYVFEGVSKIQIFLDYGYPLVQTLFVAIATVSLLVSRNFLGGVLKKPIIFLIFALIVQSFSDLTFLKEAIAGTWYVGNINDFFYLLSYFIMTLSLIQIGFVFNKIKNTQ